MKREWVSSVKKINHFLILPLILLIAIGILIFLNHLSFTSSSGCFVAIIAINSPIAGANNNPINHKLYCYFL